jgi:T5SS/PEP-CTERM-associated repeat protein
MGTPTNCSLGARTVYTLSITDDDSPLVTNIIDGTTVNWPGTYIVGDNDTFNALIITNAGVMNDTIGLIGNMGSALNNRVYVTGAGSLWQNSDSLIVGAAGSSNRLTLDNAATVLASNIVIGASPGATSNQINVVGGILAATNALGGGALDVRRGVLSLNGGTVTADHLYASNGPGSVVNVYTGTLDTRNTTINNGSQFRVGDGFGAATLHLNGGTHSFANGLFINTNAMLTGTGAISGAIVSAGTIAPGDSAGMITGDSNLTLLSSAVLSMGLGGTAPSLYDQLDIAGTFNFGGTLTVSLESGFMPNVADRFDLFDFSATSGAFSQLNLANLLLTEYWYDGLLYTTGELVVGDRQFAWMVTPTDGTTLASTSQTFVWDGGTGVTYYGLWIGTAPLTYNIHASVESGKSRTVTTLPSDGMPLYVTLWAFVNGVWQQGHTYTYLAATSTKAAMLTPVNGTTLSTATPTFTWNAGVSVKYYALWIGNNPGTYDIYAGLEPGLSRTLLVPSDGRTLCVTLWSFINGAWQSNAYTYTAPTAQSAQMISPADGTVLSSDRIVFNWDAGVGVTQYGLWVGNNPATYDLHASAQTGLSQTVKLPTDGRAIYVTLWSLINGAWQSNPYSYTAVTATVPVRSQMLTPTPGSTLPGATVTFTWSGGVGVTGNALWVGSSPGTYDLYSALEPGLSRTLTLPTDSRTLYITLWSWLTGVWAPVSYTCTYTAAPPPPPY